MFVQLVVKISWILDFKSFFQLYLGLFEELQEYPEQLKDWLFSNYNYVIAGTKPKPNANFTPTASEETKLNPIFEKHGIKIGKMPSKEDKLKNIAEAIANDEDPEVEMTEEELNEKIIHDLKTSKEIYSQGNDEDPELNSLQKMMMGIKKPQHNNSNDKDLQYLRDLEAKANRGKEAIMGGGSAGFRR